MWNGKKCAAIAVLGVGLAVAAATSASAWWPGAYANAGGCGYSGYAPAYGYAGGCGYGAYGYTRAYAGVYSYGWPYGTVGHGDCGGYGYAGGCGYASSGYAPAYGAYGYGPASYGYGCRARHPHGHGGYALAYVPRSCYHGNYGSASNTNFSARRHFTSIKQIAHGG